MSLQPVIDDCGLKITGYKPVHGGDINEAWCIYTGGTQYFLKINSALSQTSMFEKEARGLLALHEVCVTLGISDQLTVPAVKRFGTVDDLQYLLLEWIDAGRPVDGFWENVGRALAILHQQRQPFFGWHEDNYIGTLVQENTPEEQWPSFYISKRIQPLITLLFDNGAFTAADLKAAEKLYTAVESLFPPEQPSLLHGDLWSGNFMITSSGAAAIYDPAVYFGHREMDLGMTRLFGGFDAAFYDAYHEQYPLSPGWKERIQINQLFPLLVHAILFGGHYIGRARDVIRRF